MSEARAPARGLTAAELENLNRWPVGELARVAIEAGADPVHALSHAQELVERYGTSRTIDADSGSEMYRAMWAWDSGSGEKGS